MTTPMSVSIPVSVTCECDLWVGHPGLGRSPALTQGYQARVRLGLHGQWKDAMWLGRQWFNIASASTGTPTKAAASKTREKPAASRFSHRVLERTAPTDALIHTSVFQDLEIIQFSGQSLKLWCFVMVVLGNDGQKQRDVGAERRHTCVNQRVTEVRKRARHMWNYERSFQRKCT